MMNKIGLNTFGILSSAPNESTIIHIYAYIIATLQDFEGGSDESENAITNRLCLHLSNKNPPESPYFFHHQNLEDEKENTSTDFAVFATVDSECPISLAKIEAKRLSSSLPKKRKREYLLGEYKNGERIKNSGGVERFKNGRHGKDVVNACILGYVQSDSFEHWSQQINAWIGEEIENPHDNTLTWDGEDMLMLIQSNAKIAAYTSESKRLFGAPIKLRHLWVNFVAATSPHKSAKLTKI
jgi:hypothetical protein